MGKTVIIFKRELYAYFSTPLAYVFIVIFLVMNGIFTFDLAAFLSAARQICNRFSVSIPGCTCL
jgi:ABC-2 type transport system permease protein